MDTEELKRQIWSALTGIEHPGTGRDIVEAGRVQELEVAGEGEVEFAFRLSPDDPGGLVNDARNAVEAVEGVSDVKVNVRLPQTASGGGAGGGGGGPRGAPAGARAGAGPGGGAGPGSVPAPSADEGLLTGVDHIVAVSSGKGGVGKSMVAANIAVALAADGHRVGLLDADVYGPNIPIMFGESRRPRVARSEDGQELIEPLEAHGVRLMSLGFLLDSEQPAIMRGPLISGILKQFLGQVEWGELDVLVVDMPPGTGDAQLSLVQTIDIDGAVMVSTPQNVATGDVRRGVRMFERVNTRVLGIVENMSGFRCPHCGEEVDVFGTGGARTLAGELEVPFLGAVPLDPAVREAGDEGVPTVAGHPESAAGRALKEVARQLAEALEEVPA